jgi:YidC/Oxa1 family membrane protein insertase
MLNVLYTLIIYPLMQIIELVYVAFDHTFYVHGVSIIGVSIAVTLLCLPLYIVAEHWQQVERDTEKKLDPGVKRIKSVFRGDEQYMILSTYYRQNHYHPIMALRSSFGLLIQIPFFIAAYIFLSRLPQLKGASFLFIRDLGTEDAMFHIGSFPVNVLPVAMTVINIIAGAVYTKGFKIKDKIQLYAMAVVFLVVLYRSPSGLVLYWTMNNLFSLVKNVYYKLRHPLRALYVTLVAMLFGVDIYFLASGTALEDAGYLIAISLLVPFVPFVYSFIRSNLKVDFAGFLDHDGYRNSLFILSAAVFTILTGFVTPSNVIVSSPQEFSFIDSYTTPLFFVQNSFLQAVGAFFVWPIAIYFLFPKRVQSFISALFAMCAFAAMVNAFLFPGSYGFISPLLIFENDNGFNVSAGHMILNNSAMFIILAGVIVLLYYKQLRTLVYVMMLCTAGLAGLGVKNSIDISREFKKLAAVYSPKKDEGIEPVFHLSRTGKNVFVIMLDRAISGFIPAIMDEDPGLKSVYSGFTYYPNTVSFGFFTLQGAPALYGGYEYTPLEINKRNNESLVSKHNEALAVLPRLFARNGYAATMADAPWANYSWISDMSYMHRYPEHIETLQTMRTYKDEWYRAHGAVMPAVQSTLNKRNFIWYGLMKDLPFMLRKAAYNDGDYWACSSVASRNNTFLNSYAVLDFLPKLTAVDASTDTFTYIDNDTTHDPVLCQAPDYVPVETVTNRGTSPFASDEHYHGNAAAIHRIGDWIKYLKAEGVYDNTRIIIASDHGRDIYTGQFKKERKLPFMREYCNPLLLVKDFNASGDIATDNAFMTNADVPSLAVKDIIKDPRNPFTGKLITSEGRKKLVTITSTKNWVPGQQNKNTLAVAPNDWFTVHDSIFSEKNWQQVKIKQAKDGQL